VNNLFTVSTAFISIPTRGVLAFRQDEDFHDISETLPLSRENFKYLHGAFLTALD